MILSIDLSENSIDAAVNRLNQAKANLLDSCNQMVDLMVKTAYWQAEDEAQGFVWSGDLLRNLQENEAESFVAQTVDGVFECYVKADVVAETNAGDWRPYHPASAWKGRHYAGLAEFGSRRRMGHYYMKAAHDAVVDALPSFIQAVKL